MNRYIVLCGFILVVMISKRFEKRNALIRVLQEWTDDRFFALTFVGIKLVWRGSLECVLSLFNIPSLCENRKCAPKQVHVHQRTRVLRTLCTRVRALNCGFESISLNLECECYSERWNFYWYLFIVLSFNFPYKN